MSNMSVSLLEFTRTFTEAMETEEAFWKRKKIKWFNLHFYEQTWI